MVMHLGRQSRGPRRVECVGFGEGARQSSHGTQARLGKASLARMPFFFLAQLGMV